MKNKLTGIVVGTTLVISGVAFTDAQINPYVEKLDRMEMAQIADVSEAGEQKIELLKDRPEMRLKKWNSEIDLGVSYSKVKGKGNRPFLSNRMEWKDADEEVHAYPVDEGFEFEVVLKSKPLTNIFSFEITGAQDLDFFYQPILTAQEIAEGAIRPDNVIGSYAVYHKTKANHRVGSTNYATGKAFHIYRPKAIDANGVEMWAELNITGGILSVTVPQSFLDSAVYPVRVDPTFGFTTAGAGNAAIAFLSNDTCVRFGAVYNLPEAGTLSKITTWLRSPTTIETADTTVFINIENPATDSHTQVAKVQRSAITFTTSYASYDFTAADESLSVNDYILNAVADGVDLVTNPIQMAYDTAGTRNRYSEQFTGASGYTNAQESPWTNVETSAADKPSIYATYTASASPSGSTQGLIIFE